MNEAQISAWSKALLMKIHVITGWTIPDSSLLIVLIDQFQKKLVESYPNMNVDEIEWAFRNKGTVVKDWGKAMNLSLIDQVLIPYLDERKTLSHELEERLSAPPDMKLLTDEELNNLHRRDVEQFYQRCRKGWIPGKIPDYFKEILVKDKLIKQGDSVEVFFGLRLGRNAENVYVNENGV